MQCEHCGKEIVGEPAAVIDSEGSTYYCYEEPLDDSCYVAFLQSTDKEWFMELIHSELD